MPAEIGNNEGFHVLDDFVCEVSPAPGVSHAILPGSGKNEGMGMIISDNKISCHHPPFSASELQRMTNVQLLDLIEISGSELSPEDLQLIHDIAIERMAENGPAVSEIAIKVSKEAMHLTLHRMA